MAAVWAAGDGGGGSLHAAKPSAGVVPKELGFETPAEVELRPYPRLAVTTGSQMDALWQNIRYAARTLARSPGFTAIGVLVLAPAIGVNTAICSRVSALIFVTLPVPDAEERRFIYPLDPNAPRDALPALRRGCLKCQI